MTVYTSYTAVELSWIGLSSGPMTERKRPLAPVASIVARRGHATDATQEVGLHVAAVVAPTPIGSNSDVSLTWPKRLDLSRTCQ